MAAEGSDQGNQGQKKKRVPKQNVSKLMEEIEKNKQALEELKGIPEKINEIFNLLKPVEVQDDKTDNGSVASKPDADLTSTAIEDLLAKSQEIDDHEESTAATTLSQILDVMQPETAYGLPINKDIARPIESMYNMDNSKPTKDKLHEKFKVPQNCELLGVPKVNPEVWPLLPAYVRQKDYSLQQQQANISVASVAVARMAEMVFTADSKSIDSKLRESLLRTCMETCSALAIASDDMSKKRKFEIKPVLNKEFSTICTTSKISAGLLFGENISEQLKTTKASSQMIKSVVKHDRQQQRFHPYKRINSFGRNLNFQSPPWKNRGAFNQRQFSQRSRGTRPTFPRPHRPQQN